MGERWNRFQAWFEPDPNACTCESVDFGGYNAPVIPGWVCEGCPWHEDGDYQYRVARSVGDANDG